MKNRIKTTLKLTLICSLFFFLSCEKDLYEEQIIKQTKTTTEKISINQVLSEISNPLIKDYINVVLQQELGLSQFRTSSQDYFNFIKIIKQDDYTTYSLLLNGYSDDKPYFKYFIITKEGITERAGYFKYIPNNEELVFNEKELNGKIQVLDVENNIKGETIFISSQPQPPLSTQSIDCVDTYDVITHNCTNGGNHPPGVPCGGGAVNNGYYEIVVTTTCTMYSDYHYISPPIDFMGISSGTGGGDMLSLNINVLQYIFSLTEEQYSILQQNPSLVTYLEIHDASSESIEFVDSLINTLFSYSTQFNQTNENQVFSNSVLNNIFSYLNEFGDTVENKEVALNFIGETLIYDFDASSDGNEAIAPDCQSFNFTTNQANPLWQESAVLNIHFTVVVLTPQGAYVSHVIEFPQPMLFGVPNNITIGNTNLSAGMAASLSAQALWTSMNETVKAYGNKPVSEMMVRLYFESRLKHNYPLFIPGGRVNIHPQNYNVVPTQYQTNFFGIGDCN